jgi:hypothetical protein
MAEWRFTFELLREHWGPDVSSTAFRHPDARRRGVARCVRSGEWDAECSGVGQLCCTAPSATSASLPSIGLLEWTGDVCRYEYNAILAFGGPQLESDDPREVIGYFDTVIRNIDIAFRQFELRANDARVAEARDLAKALVEGFRGMRPGLVNARSALQIATPGDLNALQAAVRAAIAGMDAAQKVYQDTLSRLGVPPLAEMAQRDASCQQLASR